jgi:hypothetical protein
MNEKFDPAPHDKHAAKQGADKKDELQKGLEETFPASDPVSSTQPSKKESSSE